MHHKKMNVLDARYGEGSHIYSIFQKLKENNYFKEKLDVEDIQNIRYKFDVNKEFLPHFIRMTPLTWGKSTERLNDVCQKNISSLTVDLTFIIGTKKK